VLSCLEQDYVRPHAALSAPPGLTSLSLRLALTRFPSYTGLLLRERRRA
jgi:hypothetical protein